MDDEGEWVPLVTPRTDHDEEAEMLLLIREARAQISSEDGLAGASNLLAPASPSSADSADASSFPTRRLMFTRTQVPDFAHIPKERWLDVMLTIPMHLREAAARGTTLPLDEASELIQLAWSDLPPAASDLARAEVAAKPQLAPSPAADHFRRANRQVNFRLTEPEYLDLATAAQIIGTTPSGLAAQLVRNGVRRVIEEANRPAS